MCVLTERKVIKNDHDLREIISLLKFLWEKAKEQGTTFEVEIKEETKGTALYFGD